MFFFLLAPFHCIVRACAMCFLSARLFFAFVDYGISTDFWFRFRGAGQICRGLTYLKNIISTGETRETSDLKGTNEHVHFGPRASPVTYPWLTPRRRVLSCAVVPDTPTKLWRDATSCSVNKMRFRRSGSSSARPNARRHWAGPFHFRFETPSKNNPEKDYVCWSGAKK